MDTSVAPRVRLVVRAPHHEGAGLGLGSWRIMASMPCDGFELCEERYGNFLQGKTADQQKFIREDMYDGDFLDNGPTWNQKTNEECKNGNGLGKRKQDAKHGEDPQKSPTF